MVCHNWDFFLIIMSFCYFLRLSVCDISRFRGSCVWYKADTSRGYSASAFITSTNAAEALINSLPTMLCCREVVPSGFDGAERDSTHAVTGKRQTDKTEPDLQILQEMKERESAAQQEFIYFKRGFWHALIIKTDPWILWSFTLSHLAPFTFRHLADAFISKWLTKEEHKQFVKEPTIFTIYSHHRTCFMEDIIRVI